MEDFSMCKNNIIISKLKILVFIFIKVNQFQNILTSYLLWTMILDHKYFLLHHVLQVLIHL